MRSFDWRIRSLCVHYTYSTNILLGTHWTNLIKIEHINANTWQPVYLSFIINLLSIVYTLSFYDLSRCLVKWTFTEKSDYNPTINSNRNVGTNVFPLVKILSIYVCVWCFLLTKLDHFWDKCGGFVRKKKHFPMCIFLERKYLSIAVEFRCSLATY